MKEKDINQYIIYCKDCQDIIYSAVINNFSKVISHLVLETHDQTHDVKLWERREDFDRKLDDDWSKH